MSCIEARGLSKSYGRVAAVDGMDLSVRTGEVFGLLGPNGAGKSTTIKLLTTLVPPTSGSVTVLGIDAVRDPLRVRHRIGVVLQQPSYEPTLSVEKSLDKYGMMWDVPRRERAERTERLLGEFDLGDIRKRRNEDLSIGQRRRVQVAREFMHDMDLLFLDEPTVGLDPAARRALLDYLRGRTRGGLTILYTTHILSEAEYLCDRIAIMDGGRVATEGTPGGLKSRLGSTREVRMRLGAGAGDAAALLAGVGGCTVDGADVVIRAERPEPALLEALGRLTGAGIAVEDLSAGPASLEETFLRMVRKGAPDS